MELTARNFNGIFPSNLHTHTPYCDGHNTIGEFIDTACANNFISLGFSGHSYLTFTEDYAMSERGTFEYVAELKEIKANTRDIEIYIGIEADYYSGITKSAARKQGFDYTIGSVHYVANAGRTKFYCVDSTPDDLIEGINALAAGDVKKYIAMYYGLVMQMADEQQPDIIGHIDLIKKRNDNGSIFDENAVWYKQIVDNTLQYLAKKQVIIEVNTGGMARGYTDFPYPSRFMLEKMLEYGIPVTICSDAHRVTTLTHWFPESITVLREIGFKSVKILYNNTFQDFLL